MLINFRADLTHMITLNIQIMTVRSITSYHQTKKIHMSQKYEFFTNYMYVTLIQVLDAA